MISDHDVVPAAGGPVILSDELRADIEHARETADAALSERSRQAYQSEFAKFAAYCARHNLPSLPTTPAVVCTYLAHLNKTGKAVSTLSVVRAAIRHYHATLPASVPGRDIDLSTPEIRRLTAGSRRMAKQAGRVTNQARPWTVAEWNDLARMIGGRSELEDARDLAMIGLGIVRALRGPSELLRLDYQMIGTPDARGALIVHAPGEGATIRLATSKTAQHDGEELHIEDGPAVEAIRLWIRLADIRPGQPVWRATRRGKLQDTRMHQRTLHNVIQRRARQRLRWTGKTLAEAEAEAAEYSTHSLRRGALTSMGEAGATVSEMLDLSRHSPSSARIMLGYVKPENRGAKAMRKLGM